MKNHTIISIVPTLPPALNGLGDFGWLLANELKKTFQQNTVFFSTDTFDNLDKTFHVEFLNNRNAKDLASLLQKQLLGSILVHYVGYAYSPSGLPYWLVKGLQQHKEKDPKCRIVTVFHELYSTGHPWTKDFWTNPFQRDIVFRLLNLSDRVICNTEITHSILQKKSPENKVVFLPVFSNVGEPSTISAFHKRKDWAIVFGSASLRKRLYKCSGELEYWFKKLQIEQIIEIGPERSDMGKVLFSIPIEYKGVLPAASVSEILQSVKYGFIHYPSSLLSKSGVFASYAAHGVAPIVLSDAHGKKSDNKNKICCLSTTETVNPEVVSQNCFSWYQDHSVEKTSKVIFDLLTKKELFSNFIPPK